MGHEGDATIIATLCPISLLVKHLNRCIFPLLQYATSPPHDDIVELSERVQEEGCRWGNLVFGVTGRKIEKQKNGKISGVSNVGRVQDVGYGVLQRKGKFRVIMRK